VQLEGLGKLKKYFHLMGSQAHDLAARTHTHTHIHTHTHMYIPLVSLTGCIPKGSDAGV
jgi:hypothetical protein